MTDPATSASNRPNRPTLLLIQLLWAFGVLGYLWFYLAYLPGHWRFLYNWLAAAEWQDLLTRYSLTPSLVAGYLSGLQLLTVIAAAAMAGIMFWRKPREPIVLLISFTLLAIGVSAGSTALVKNMDTPYAWARLLDAASSVGFSMALLAFCIVPDGRFVPRWTKLLLGLWVAWMLAGLVFPEVGFFRLRGDGVKRLPNGFILFVIAQAVVYGLGVLAQIYRYLRVSTLLQRQQTKWGLFGMVLVLAGYLLNASLQLAFPPLSQPGTPGLFYLLLCIPILYNLPRLLLPVFIGIAILRYRLWDIDSLINRSLVYGALTISVVVLYLSSVSLLQLMFRSATGQVSDPAIVLSTALIAVIFQPLRRSLQNGIDRRFYREKINFRQAFQVFTREVRHYTDLPELLHVIVHRITKLFHSMHGALYLYQESSNVFQLTESYNLPQNLDTLQASADQLKRLQAGEIIAQPKNNAFPVLVPLIALWANRRELVGVLALGPKLSEAQYAGEDLSQLTTLVDEAGTAISLAQAFAEKHKAVQARQAAEEVTQAVVANHEAVLNNIADGVLVLDLEGRFLSANPALRSMIPEEDLQEMISKPLEKTIQSRRKVFSVTTAPVPEVGMVAVFRDETRRHETERAKDAMLATASHELRTPLTAVMNYLELMLMMIAIGKVNLSEFGEHLTRALENSKRLKSLLLAILEHAQIQAGRFELKRQRFNLASVFEKARQLLASLIEQKGLSYALIIHPDVPEELIGDPERLHQVLVNLIGNAVKFTDRGGVKVTVSPNGPEKLSIAVADTGSGIPPERLPDIFEAFRRGSDYAHRQHQGAGLGLSIAKEIVTRMGGNISVSSEPGAGSIFTISIPIDIAD